MPKVIHSILLGLVLGATAHAHAATELALYGLVDLGLVYDKTSGKASNLAIDSGNTAGSRWGLRGSEELSAGLQAVYLLESGVSADTGALGQNGRLFGRWAYVGLAGSAAELRLGRQWNLGREWGGLATPFGIAWSNAALGATFGYNDGDFGGSGILDNVAMLRSKKYAGFEAAAGYSLSADGNEVPGDANNDRVFTSGLRYSQGPLQAALTYENLHVDARRRALQKPARDANNVQFAAAYDFKVLRLHGGVGRVAGSNKGPARNLRRDYAYSFGARVPVGTAGALLTAWQHSAHSKIKVFSLGYQHDLSKRSALYTFFNHTRTRDFASMDDVARRQFSIGLRHRF